MSEEQNANSVGVKLPIKTKIAVWWLYIVLTALFISAFVVLSSVSNTDAQGPVGFVTVCIAFPICLLFLIPGFLLPLKKRFCWTISILMLSLEIFGTVGGCIYLAATEDWGFLYLILFDIIFLIPLILLVLDRKNYFEMVRQRELEKNAKE